MFRPSQEPYGVDENFSLPQDLPVKPEVAWCIELYTTTY